MPEPHTESHCLSCNASESDVPLVRLVFRAQHLHICPQCLPTLIHQPERLATKLAARGSKTSE